MTTENPRQPLPTSFRFSQASLQDYSDCPRRFRLRYIEQLDWPAVESEPVVENERRQQEGLIFHRLVQQHLLGIDSQKLERMANSSDLARWWHNYLEANLGFDGYAKYAEPILSSPLGTRRLLAKFDLIAVQPGSRAVIFDWKTYAKRPRDEWLAARWQTRVYRALLARSGSHLNGGVPIPPEQIEMVYWFADFPTQPARFQYDANQFKRDWSALETLAAEIASVQDFPLTEDLSTCRFCVYRSYCERGSQAGQESEAESEVEQAAAFDINFEQIGEIEF